MPEEGARAQIGLAGAVHMDRIAHGALPVTADTSTPGSIRARPGGVAANVAQLLASAGHRVALAGRVGGDADGAALVHGLTVAGVDCSGVDRKAIATGSYLALHDPDGSLVAAVADSAATESLSAVDILGAAGSAFAGAPFWFVDANLTDSCLRAVAEAAGSRRLAADCVSVAKAGRLRGLFARLDVVFANRGEANVLLAREASTAVDAAARLRDLGVGLAVVTDGAQGLAIAGADGTVAQPAMPARPVDVTGAGDAVIAAVLSSLLFGRPIDQTAAYAARAAASAVAREGAASALTPERPD